jgi:hypothetical protein
MECIRRRHLRWCVKGRILEASFGSGDKRCWDDGCGGVECDDLEGVACMRMLHRHITSDFGKLKPSLKKGRYFRLCGFTIRSGILRHVSIL